MPSLEVLTNESADWAWIPVVIWNSKYPEEIQMHLNLLIDMKVPIQDATSVLVERKRNTEPLLLANTQTKQNKWQQ